jgi:hypothetical protein
MARIYPSDVFEQPADPKQDGELATLRTLQAKLTDDYAIFHSLHWASADRRCTRYGEIDFVVVNQSGDVLVIEQKDGPLEEIEGELVKRYRNGPKTVSSQIQRNIGGIRDKFSRHHGGEAGLLIDYLLYCPDHRLLRVNGAGLDACRIVDRRSCAELPERITSLLGPGSDESSGVRDRVLRFFADSFHVAPDVGAFLRAQEQSFTRMLEGLGDVVDNLDFEPFRLRVVGTAGCGKTQLTLRQATRFVDSGRRVLQLCFNRPLADSLRALMPAAVRVDTYYGFCKSTLESLGHTLADPSATDPDYWRRLQDQLLAEEIPERVRYDALIIDEGQDFQQEWWEILELFLSENAAVLWLEDPLQNIRQTEPVELEHFVTYREDANFRTPTTIAPFVQSVLGVEFTARNPLPGLGLRVEPLKPGKPLAAAVGHRISELLKHGFTKDQITVVSCRGMGSSALAEVDRTGSFSLRRFTGEYQNAQQVYSDGDIYFDSIYRFKGQQSPVVLVVDLDERLDTSERSRHLLYCAMTRATVRLELLVSEDCPWLPVMRSA